MDHTHGSSMSLALAVDPETIASVPHRVRSIAATLAPTVPQFSADAAVAASVVAAAPPGPYLRHYYC
ncbi:hypothetical protein PG990_003296 [Apiospora arundinis]